MEVLAKKAEEIIKQLAKDMDLNRLTETLTDDVAARAAIVTRHTRQYFGELPPAGSGEFLAMVLEDETAELLLSVLLLSAVLAQHDVLKRVNAKANLQLARAHGDFDAQMPLL